MRSRPSPALARRPPLAALALAALLLSCGGCLSIYATWDHPTRPYAGTREFVHRWPLSGLGPPAGPVIAFFGNILLPLDLPGTFALDTLLLPFTGVAAFFRWLHHP